MIFVKLCILVAQTTDVPQVVDTGDIRFTTTKAQNIYRCEYVRENQLNNYLQAKGISSYRLKVERKGWVIQ